MNSLRQLYYDIPFSHIYIEKEIWDHPRTKRILHFFPKAVQIEISHYKDVFCRKKQNVNLQNQTPMLILAKKREPYLYPGAEVCQNFGEEHFYYTSCIMNCIFNCSYCYLKGMYPSGNLVIFVNLEDVFWELERRLQEHPVYLCISYDTDLLALERITGFVEDWNSFVKTHAGLTIECRTKCGRSDFWNRVSANERMIFAFTLSPQKVVETSEQKTPALSERILAAKAAMDAGFSVRLCFDPMIYISDWKKHYELLVKQVNEQIDWGRVKDVSVGSFRISQDYLKKMRKAMPLSQVVQFPFVNEKGVYHYPSVLMNEMETYLVGMLKKNIPEERIFRWND